MYIYIHMYIYIYVFVYEWSNLTLEFCAHRLNQTALLSPFMLKKKISRSRWCVKSTKLPLQVAMIFSRSFAKATVNGVRTECTEPCVDFCSFKTGNHRRHTRCYGRHNFFQDRQPLKFSVFLFLSIDMSLKAHPTRATFTCHMTWRPREPDVHVLQTSTDQVVLYRTCGWISA